MLSAIPQLGKRPLCSAPLRGHVEHVPDRPDGVDVPSVLAFVARCEHELVTLPESPQHRLWRESREAASKRMVEFRAGLRQAIGEARVLLKDRDASSVAWFELAERLQDACS